jgi:hypothetical protein
VVLAFLFLYIFFSLLKKQFTNMKNYKFRYLWALVLMLGVAGHLGCGTDDIGPVIKIPCYGEIDACQNKILHANYTVSAVYKSRISYSPNDIVFIYRPQKEPQNGGEFRLCNPEKLKGLNLKAAKTYADGEKYVFKINLREGCNNAPTIVQPIFYAEIISIESVPTSN